MGTNGRILLTGGGGMAGSNILEHPNAKNWEFIAPTSKEVDLTDYNVTLELLKETSPQMVFLRDVSFPAAVLRRDRWSRPQEVGSLPALYTRQCDLP